MSPARSRSSVADVPAGLRSPAELRAAAATCRACDLWRTGTQTVFGEGKPTSTVMFIGEQPGNQEDLQGKPFVGPAGNLLDKALAEAGIDRTKVYVTNVVKHFKWEPRGKRRIHAKPSWSEVAACRPWLDAELDVVRPAVLVLLGATAAQALLGRSFRVTQQRGHPIEETGFGDYVVATVHPSAILRIRDGDERHRAKDDLAADLRAAHALLP